MWDGLTGPGPKMDMDLWRGKTFAILPPGHISRSSNQDDNRGAGVLSRQSVCDSWKKSPNDTATDHLMQKYLDWISFLLPLSNFRKKALKTF